MARLDDDARAVSPVLTASGSAIEYSQFSQVFLFVVEMLRG